MIGGTHGGLPQSSFLVESFSLGVFGSWTKAGSAGSGASGKEASESAAAGTSEWPATWFD
jgi:hypothetical protein